MKLIKDDCLTALRKMDANSIDSLVTDPPAGISFMGKDWDHNKGGSVLWIAWMKEIMQEVHRVLKPGAHGLVWAIPRTSHWTATALENAGFEIRDVVTHLFGTGFPKSLNVGKAVPEFEGWGTALKPASEHWILVRKPCSEKTVAKNVEKWGTGGINIDGCRVAGENPSIKRREGKIPVGNYNGWEVPSRDGYDTPRAGEQLGRFPANLVLDEQAAEILDEQTKNLHGAGSKRSGGLAKQSGEGGLLGVGNHDGNGVRFGDSGGASRFFYIAKASKSERGLDNKHPTVKSLKLMSYLCRLITPPGGTVLDPFMGSGSTGVAAKADGFKFIGIEKEQEYFSIAWVRVSEVV